MLRLRFLALMVALFAFALAFTIAGAADKADKAKKPKNPKTPPAAKAESSSELISSELMEKLALSEEQKEKVGKLQKEFEEKTSEGKKKIEAARTAAGKDKAALKKVADDEKAFADSNAQLRKDLEAKVVEGLTDEQKTKFQEMRKDTATEGPPPGEQQPKDKKKKSPPPLKRPDNTGPTDPDTAPPTQPPAEQPKKKAKPK